MRLHVVLATVLAACGGTPQTPVTPAPSTTSEYDGLLTRARSMLELGRADRAIDLAAAAAARDPDRPQAYVAWGRALASQDRLPQAAEKYERARALGSEDRQLYVELSSVYDVAEQYERAIAVYRDWLARAPNDAEMQQELGLTLLLRERFGEAAASLRRASELSPADPQVLQDLGYALLRSRDLEGASNALEQVLALEPDRAQALRLLAQTRAAQGRAGEALALLDRAVAKDPRDPRARRARARLRQLLGDDAGALADYQALLERGADDGPALLGAAGGLLALGRTAEAAPLVARARAGLGDLPEVRLREAQLAWRKGERSAVKTLRALAEKLPNASEAWRDLARAAERFGDERLRAEAKRRLAETR